MKRSAALMTALIFLAGCQSQSPSLNLLAPYGATRVPPPGTGSFGKPDTYYQPKVQPNTSTGDATDKDSFNARPLASVEAAGAKPGVSSSNATAQNKRRSTEIELASTTVGDAPRADKSVKQAVASKPPEDEPPVRIVESGDSKASESLPIKGMAVNDATRPAEPKRLEVPDRVLDISQLPKPAAPVSAQPATARSPQAKPPANSSSTRDAGTPSSTAGDSGWRVKTDAPGETRVAGR